MVPGKSSLRKCSQSLQGRVRSELAKKKRETVVEKRVVVKIGLIKMLSREKTTQHGKNLELKASYEITLKSEESGW